MNHEYRMKFINKSWIIEVKQDWNHEYPKSNDSASTPSNSQQYMEFGILGNVNDYAKHVKLRNYFVVITLG